jgi:copper chaperone CopZ
MKNIKYLLLIGAVCCTLFVSAANNPSAKRANTRETVVLTCDIHCQGCCDKIMKNIAFEKGVKDLQCDLKTKTVTVTYDAAKTDVPTLLKAFDKIGKPAKVKQIEEKSQKNTQ